VSASVPDNIPSNPQRLGSHEPCSVAENVQRYNLRSETPQHLGWLQQKQVGGWIVLHAFE